METLSTQVKVDEEALKQDKASHKEHIVALKKNRNNTFDEGMKVVYDAFKNIVDHPEVMCLGVQVLWKRMDPEKVVINKEIISDHKENEGWIL